MTVTGTTLGSVHYFSPEQARGDQVTGASDVYALAIVLFEMLTGRRPFEADSAAAVALKRLSEDAPTPTSIGHPVAPGLEAILMRALSREQAERYPDAGAFAEALRVWRRDPGAVPPVAPGATAAAAAGTPPAGEPTVYIPPRVTTPGRPHAGGAAAASRRLRRPPARRGSAMVDLAAGGAGRDPARRHRLPGGAAARFGRSERVADAVGRAGHRARVRGRGADDAALPAGRPGHHSGRRTRRPPTRSTRETSSAASPRAARRSPRGAPCASSSRAARRRSRSRACAARPSHRPRRRCESPTCRVGEVDFEPDPEVPDGSVIRSDPPSGNTVAAREPGEPRHQQRPDAVADAVAHAGADAGAHAGADAGAHAGPDADLAATPDSLAIARGTAGARMSAIPFPRLGGTFDPP